MTRRMAGPCGVRRHATARPQRPGRRARRCWIGTTRASADHTRTAFSSWAAATAAPDLLPFFQSSSSPWPPNSTMSCWADRSSAGARPLPPCPRLRARRRRSWRAVAMTRCARASSGSVATSSFHSVQDNRAASRSMLLRKDASSLSDGGDWCLIPCLGFGAGRCSGAAGIGAGAPKKSACRRSAFGLRATFWPFPPGWTPRWHSRFVGSTRSRTAAEAGSS